MAIIKCPECGNDISDKATTCPHCGVNVQDELHRINYKPNDEETNNKQILGAEPENSKNDEAEKEIKKKSIYQNNKYAKKCMDLGIATPVLWLLVAPFMYFLNIIASFLGLFFLSSVLLWLSYIIPWASVLGSWIGSIVFGAKSLQQETNNMGYLFIGFLCDGVTFLIFILFITGAIKL